MMDKKEFERLAGCKVTEKYYRNALQGRMYVGNYMSDEAFVKEWTGGADNSELVAGIIRRTEELNQMLIKEKTDRSELDALVSNKVREVTELRLRLDQVRLENTRFAEANQAMRLKLADRPAEASSAETDDAARWKSAAEGMKRRMQTMIETELIKCGWRAVNFQAVALLLQLLREELPEFDLVAYLKELSLKYNH